MATVDEAIQGIEVDWEDGDSGIGGLDSSTINQSIRSSVYEFIEENGRTYHEYHGGRKLRSACGYCVPGTLIDWT
jgi:hypothetical protein